MQEIEGSIKVGRKKRDKISRAGGWSWKAGKAWRWREDLSSKSWKKDIGKCRKRKDGKR